MPNTLSSQLRAAALTVGIVLTVAACKTNVEPTAMPSEISASPSASPTPSPTPSPSLTPSAAPVPVVVKTTTKPPIPKPKRTTSSPKPKPACHPNYSVCLPVVPDLDCGEISYKNFKVIGGSDPYRLDRDNDGIACES